MKYFVMLLAMTLIGSVASFFLKKASRSETIVDLVKNKHIYIGGFLYLTSAVINIIVLRYLDYSVVLPLTAVTYIWTLCISQVFLGEKITFKKVLGIVFILVGAVFIAW